PTGWAGRRLTSCRNGWLPWPGEWPKTPRTTCRNRPRWWWMARSQRLRAPLRPERPTARVLGRADRIRRLRSPMGLERYWATATLPTAMDGENTHGWRCQFWRVRLAKRT